MPSQIIYSSAYATLALADAAAVAANAVLAIDSSFTLAGATTLAAPSVLFLGGKITRGANTLSMKAADGAEYDWLDAAGTGAVTFGDTPSISVTVYGATGNGTTDDSNAIQRCITDNRMVRVPQTANHYKITTQITVPDFTTVTGSGAAGQIWQVTANQAVFLVTGDRVTLENLYAKGILDNSVNAAGVAASGTDSLTVQGCTFENWSFGVYFHATTNSAILENRFWRSSTDWTGNGSYADIFMYGNNLPAGISHRTVISGNMCFSNLDGGISIGTNAGDQDLVVTDNICVPLGTDGITEVADLDNWGRYGIIVGYNGNISLRTVVSNNYLRNWPYVGIYSQGGTVPAGDVLISSNVVSRCGWGTRYPTDTSLRAGIMMASGGADVVEANAVYDCSTNGIKIAPGGTPSTDSPRTLCNGNSVARTDGVGIYITARTFECVISDNRVLYPTGVGILFGPNGTGADCVISNNQVITNSLKEGIMIDNSFNAQNVITIDSNFVKGSTSESGTDNLGIYVRGPYVCRNNYVTTFAIGIYNATGNNARIVDNNMIGNHLVNCQIGIADGGGTGTHAVTGNDFTACMYHLQGTWIQGVVTNAWQDGTEAIRLISAASTVSPTTGTWARGDYVRNSAPAVGSPKGWVCTVAGNPGTWVSEGNL